MRNFVVKLAAWHRLCKDHEHAQLRLAQAEAMRGAPSTQMSEDVHRLQRARDRALGELQAAADACMKTARRPEATMPVAKQAIASSRWGDGLERLTPAQNLSLG